MCAGTRQVLQMAEAAGGDIRQGGRRVGGRDTDPAWEAWVIPPEKPSSELSSEISLFSNVSN